MTGSGVRAVEEVGPEEPCPSRSLAAGTRSGRCSLACVRGPGEVLRYSIPSGRVPRGAENEGVKGGLPLATAIDAA